MMEQDPQGSVLFRTGAEVNAMWTPLGSLQGCAPPWFPPSRETPHVFSQSQCEAKASLARPRWLRRLRTWAGREVTGEEQELRLAHVCPVPSHSGFGRLSADMTSPTLSPIPQSASSLMGAEGPVLRDHSTGEPALRKRRCQMDTSVQSR